MTYKYMPNLVVIFVHERLLRFNHLALCTLPTEELEIGCIPSIRNLCTLESTMVSQFKNSTIACECACARASVVCGCNFVMNLFTI